MKIDNLKPTIVALFTVIFLSCQDKSAPVAPGEEAVPYNENAMEMDLYLSDQLLPSGRYHDNIVRDLRKFPSMVDTAYHHILEQQFLFPYEHNVLLIGFDDTTRALVDAGEYHAWDSLNAEYKLDDMAAQDTWYRLRFQCCIHIIYLEPIYEVLPGVNYAGRNLTNERKRILYPRAYGDTLSYFYRCGGDCTFDGCLYYEYLYFRSVQRRVEYVGYWRSDSGTEKPEWWDEANENRDEYFDKLW